MGKGANKKLMSEAGYAGSQSQTLNKRAGSDYGFLDPTLIKQAQNPQGYSPQQMAYMRTASEQSLGGGDAATTGQANLEATRTRNTGGFQGAVGTANRANQRQASENAVSIEEDQAKLQQQQKQQALTQLQQLYGTNIGAGTDYTNSAITALHDENQSHPKQQGINTAANMIKALAEAGAAACPVEGSLYLMADGSEKPVENLVVGDKIMGVDDEPETIEEIQSGMCHAIQVRTENGHSVRNSPTHAFVLPKGGFTVAARSLGKTILTAEGPSKVVSIEPAGLARVFNVITNGSHSYRADGVWALGVGEAERNVSMAEWSQIGEQIFKDRTKWAGA